MLGILFAMAIFIIPFIDPVLFHTLNTIVVSSFFFDHTLERR